MVKIKEYVSRKIGIKDATKIILFVSVLALYFATVANAVSNLDKPVPQGFQRLSDVDFFNNTGAIPSSMAENILVPAGFFEQLVKPNIKSVQPSMPPNPAKNIPEYARGQIPASSVPSPGDI